MVKVKGCDQECPGPLSEISVICNDSEALSAFRQALLSWYACEKRPLPWRQSYNPYQVWISEIMGQQTQMERVVDYFSRWITSFPDALAVALAPEQNLLKAWEGLGYYTRVRNIQRTAQILVSKYDGCVPDDYQQLLDLPGIGPYTAAAISSIAFNQPVPLLDANVERVFARLADIGSPIKQGAIRQKMQAQAEYLLVRENARDFNQALMELGALICTPKTPQCPRCPLGAHCKALAAGTVVERPVPGKKKKLIDITMACGIIRHKGKVYIQQRLPQDVWGSLWEFPGGSLEAGETPEVAVTREVLEETEFAIQQLQFLSVVVHHYTRYRVTLHGYLCSLKTSRTSPVLHAASRYAWVTLEELAAYPFPAGHRQLIRVLNGN